MTGFEGSEAVVVDASVAVKWYVPERDHEAARAVRDGYLDGEYDLLAPELFPFEVVNALRYSGHYEGDRLTEAAESLADHGVELVAFDRLGPVATVADDLDVPIYDASYLALAATADCPLYTADERVLNATEGTEYDDHAVHVRAAHSTE